MVFENGWKKFRLEDICKKIGSGATPRGGKDVYLEVGEYSLIRSQNVLDFTFSYDGLAYINEDQASKLSNVEIEENDVLINITGDSVARVCKVPIEVLPARVNQHVAILRTENKKFSPDFLKYALLHPENKGQLLSIASTGGTRNALTKGMLQDFEIYAPENIKTQRRIAAILAAFDDKIELNRRMNRTLEAMAQALFRELCTVPAGEALPAGWQSDILENHVDVERGLSYKGAGLTDSKDETGIPMHNLNSIYEGGGYKFDGIKYYNGDYKEKHLVKPGDVIVANTEQGHKYLLIGFPAIVPKFYGAKGIFSQHIYRVRPKEQSAVTSPFLYYLLLQKITWEQVIGASNGTTVNMLSKDGLQYPKVFIPTKEIIENFTKQVIPILEKKEELYKEEILLASLRDTLLPRLMSGELEVGDIPKDL